MCFKNIVLLIVFILCFSFDGNPCTCIGNSAINVALKDADVVFVGNVIEYEYLKYNDTLDVYRVDTGSLYDVFSVSRIKYKVKVFKIIKGHINSEIIEIVSGNGNGDCGIKFEIGDKYIIYANWKTKLADAEPQRLSFLYTDICYRTRLYNKNEFDALRKLRKVSK